jgi:hypothetical protein
MLRGDGTGKLVLVNERVFEFLEALTEVLMRSQQEICSSALCFVGCFLQNSGFTPRRA